MLRWLLAVSTRCATAPRPRTPRNSLEVATRRAGRHPSGTGKLSGAGPVERRSSSEGKEVPRPGRGACIPGSGCRTYVSVRWLDRAMHAQRNGDSEHMVKAAGMAAVLFGAGAAMMALLG